MRKNIADIVKELQGQKGSFVMALVIGGTAMILILLSDLGTTQDTSAAKQDTRDAVSYQMELETRLEELISQMSGAGKTTVMVTLETGEEAVYAVDIRSGEMQEQKTHVLLDDGTALTETVYLPQVCGVAVLCEGGADIRVAARITEMVGALLDLPSNRICVEQRKS